jgi:hypothetical protein
MIGIGSPSHGDDTNLDEEDLEKRIQWWHNTIGDVRVGEIIKGQSFEDKRKQKPTRSTLL